MNDIKQSDVLGERKEISFLTTTPFLINYKKNYLFLILFILIIFLIVQRICLLKNILIRRFRPTHWAPSLFLWQNRTSTSPVGGRVHQFFFWHVWGVGGRLGGSGWWQWWWCAIQNIFVAVYNFFDKNFCFFCFSIWFGIFYQKTFFFFWLF